MNYFDYAASTPMTAEAVHVFSSLSQQCYGNTTSLHDIGTEASNILSLSRKTIATLLDVEEAGIYFTSGGTESNLLSIISLALAQRSRGNHLIVSAGEHPSVDQAMEYLQDQGFHVTTIPFNKNGMIQLDVLEKAITKQTILVSVQHINPEIGTIQPIAEIAELLKDRHIILHCDAVQSFGKVDIRPITAIVDSITVSSHKVYGPKCVGAVYIHPKHRFQPVFPGVVHERGFRGGTVNVPGIAAFATAAQACVGNHSIATYRHFRSLLIDPLQTNRHLFTIYEALNEEQQLPQIIGLGVRHLEGQLMMLELNRKGFAVSTGSACQVGQQQTSKIMYAMGIPADQAREFIRISFGQSTTEESVKQLSNQLLTIAQQYNIKIC